MRETGRKRRWRQWRNTGEGGARDTNVGEDERDGCWREGTCSVWPRGAAGGAGMEDGEQPTLKKGRETGMLGGEGLKVCVRGRVSELRRAWGHLVINWLRYLPAISLQITTRALPPGEPLLSRHHHCNHQRHLRVNAEVIWKCCSASIEFGRGVKREERTMVICWNYSLQSAACTFL